MLPFLYQDFPNTNVYLTIQIYIEYKGLSVKVVLQGNISMRGSLVVDDGSPETRCYKSAISSYYAKDSVGKFTRSTIVTGMLFYHLWCRFCAIA